MPGDLVFGPFVLSADHAKLTRDGQPFDVQPLALELLALGLRRPGELLKREALMQKLWPGIHVTDHSLTQLVFRVRTALGEHKGWWHTVPRRGFRYDGPVEERAPAPPPTRADFVGRAPDLVAVQAARAAHRFVTLKGPGGVGKTRLARELAPDAWFVDLTPAATRGDLLRAVAATLGIALDARDPVGQLAGSLRGADLVLDNYEHLAEHGDLVTTWLDRDPDLRVLVTSRRRLDQPAEHVVELAPLEPGDAVELLLPHARSDEDGDDLIALATRLDGLPLALRLVAARLRVLSARQVLDRLHRQSQVLRGPTGSLDAALQWSWDLLADHERETLAQLAVFVGAFSPDEAEHVVRVGPDVWVVDVLASLEAHSLIQVAPAGRLVLLQTVREWVRERKAAPGAEQRHGQWCADGQRDESPRTPEVVAAMRRALARRDLELLAPLTRATHQALHGDGSFLEALHLVRDAAAMAVDTDLPLLALTEGQILRELGKHEEARATLDWAAPRLEPQHRRMARHTVCLSLQTCGESDAAIALFDELLPEYVAAADVTGEGRLRTNRARSLLVLGRVDEAHTELETALRLLRQAGAERESVLTLIDIGYLHLARGTHAQARVVLHEALDTATRYGQLGNQGRALDGLAGCEPDTAKAIDYLQQALAIARRTGRRQQETAALGNLTNHLRDAERFDDALDHGRAAVETSRGVPRQEAISLVQLGAVHRDRGEPHAAHELGTRALELLAGHGDTLWGLIAQLLLGQAALDLGDVDEAQERFERVAEHHPIEAIRALVDLELEVARARRGEADLTAADASLVHLERMGIAAPADLRRARRLVASLRR